MRIAEDRVLAVRYQFNEMLLSRRRLQISTKVITYSQKRIINLHLRSGNPNLHLTEAGFYIGTETTQSIDHIAFKSGSYRIDTLQNI